MDEHIYHLSGNDTYTRIRFPGADTFSIDTNGVERLRINSTGITTVSYTHLTLPTNREV